jgi:hypothetical protein
MKFLVEVITIGGGLPGSFSKPPTPVVFSTPIVSVSMSVVQRSAGKAHINIASGGILTAADIGIDFFDFCAVCEVLLEICLLRLFISWKSSSWAVDYTEGLVTAPLFPSYVLTFRTPSDHSVHEYMP